MKLPTTLLLIITSLTSYSQEIKDKTITVNPYLSFQYYEHFTRLTLSSPDSPIEYLDGFEFEWGYTYELDIRETKLSQELSDGTRFDYSLNKIISKTKVQDSTQFKLFLDSDMYSYELDYSEQEMNDTFKQLNDSTYLYFETVEIEVPEKLRENFNLILEGEITKNGSFMFIDEKRIRLVSL